MSEAGTGETDLVAGETGQEQAGRYKPLRVWPAVVLVLIMLVGFGARHLFRILEDEYLPLLVAAMLGPALIGILILIWWLTWSRATMPERIVGVVGAAMAAGLSILLSDPSMHGAGNILITVPFGMLGFAAGTILFARMLSFQRTVIALTIALVGFGFSTLMRSEGMWGSGELDWRWRWERSAEEDFIAARKEAEKADVASDDVAKVKQWLQNPEWPRFRGADGWGQQTGATFELDWENNPPELVWKRAIGPGWSSFVVAGNRLFTQEQLGEQEAVVCYEADSGKEVWSHRIDSRFFEALGGVGPRATPTLGSGGLFVQGASGHLMRLDPETGDEIWIQDLREVANRIPPTWGFSCSPLVMGSVVIVHAGGDDGLGTLAFDIESGELAWSAEAGDHSYSSAQACTFLGQPYVLMLTNDGLNILDPETGESKLDYSWKYGGYRVLQPRVIDGDSVLLPTGPGAGTRRIKISSSEGGLQANEEWTSLAMKPDFNDLVVHNGFAYGFDGSIFACIDLQDGKRKWKRGRYGKGQVLLLKDSGVLLVITEKGEVILVAADPEGHRELAKFQAIDGRTWNHPVVVGNRLFIRNSREAACYRLPTNENDSARESESSETSASTEN